MSIEIGRRASLGLIVLFASASLIGCASTKPKATPGSVDANGVPTQSDTGPGPSLEIQATGQGPLPGSVRGVFPDWFLNPPKEDRKLFAASSAVSADMQLSLEKAILNAQHSLASQLSNAVSGKMKSFALERGVSDLDSVSTETEKVIREQVSEINLGGYVREKTEIVESPDGYRSFVLLSYKLDDKMRRFRGKSNAASKPVADDRARKAFDDLETAVTVTPVQ